MSVFDVVNYPVSAILWFWHKVFSYLIDPASGIAWALSVVFLVFTLRALLYKPFVHQVRSMRKMQEFAPQLRELQEKYGDDREKLAAELQKLQLKGFNPLGGCLPILVQIPVFFGLFQVLNGFRPGADSNFVFNANEVASFVQADLFGAKLSNTLSQSPEQLAAFGTNHAAMLTVAVPLMVAAAVATHFTARFSVQRQTKEQTAANPNAEVINRLMLWGFPAFAIIGGPLLPLAILIYWLANNFWTLGQQRVVYRKIDHEEAERASAPVVEAASDYASDGARTVSGTATREESGEVPEVIDDRSRDTDKPDESR